jgi:hypothetical protein
MNDNVKYCQIHEIYYDASLPQCPQCAKAAPRPSAPTPLGQDDMPTEPPTPGGTKTRSKYNGYVDEDAPTEFPSKGGKKILDDMEDGPTEIPRGRMLDETEIYDLDDTSLLGILWLKEGPGRGHAYKVKEGYVVGRMDGDIALDDPKVSSRHAKFTIEEGQFVLWDFGSRNGTFVNGNRIRSATPLKENDEIKFGNTIFVLKVL